MTSLTSIPRKLKYLVMTAIVSFMPAIASAAVCNISDFSVKGLGAYFLYPACLINKLLVPLAIVLEIILIIFGIMRYMMYADNETERRKGSKFMIWGIVTLFITVSVWGILGVLINTLKLGQ